MGSLRLLLDRLRGGGRPRPDEASSATARDGAPAASMTSDALDAKIIRSSAWVAISWGLRSGLSMLAMLVLVRMLEPSAFGVVALASTFVLVLEYIQRSGMSMALIHRRDGIEEAAGSALVFSCIVGVALYGASFVAAPVFASLVKAPEATDVIRVLSLLLVIRGIGVAPTAILERELMFRATAKSGVAAAVTQIGVAVPAALLGAGVWSLVWGQLAAAAVESVAVWLLTPWRPSMRRASWRVMRQLGDYGRFVAAGNLLNLFNSTVQNAVIGRLLGTAPLGIYSTTYRVADFPTSVVGYIVGRVMMPAYSLVQDDAAAFKRAFVQNVQRVALFSLPIATTMIVAAEPLIRVLFGDAWLPATTALRLIAAYTIVRAFASCAGPAFQAAGKPQLVPLWAVPQAVLVVPALYYLTPRYGVSGAALAMLLAFSASGVPAFVVALRMLHVGVGELARALGSLVLCSVLLAAALGAVLPLANRLAPGAAVALLAGGAVLVYSLGTAAFARGTVAPMWRSLRTSQA